MGIPGFSAELSLARSTQTYGSFSGGFAPAGGLTAAPQTDFLGAGADGTGTVIPAISCAAYGSFSGGFAPAGGLTAAPQTDFPSVGAGGTDSIVPATITYCPGVNCATGQYRCPGCVWGTYQNDGCTAYNSGRRQWSSVLWNIPWGQSWENTCCCTPGQPAGIASPRLPDRCVNTGLNIWGQWDVPDGRCCAYPTNTLCGNVCVNVITDPRNCGRCGNVCPSGTTCCNTYCTSLATDNYNCGACLNACHGGKYCANGVCVCPPNLIDCGGTCCDPNACCSNGCKNFSSDAQNCGGCGKVCSGGKTCQSGVCACPSGYTDCSGTCKNLSSDVLNCGGCGKVCLGGKTCQNSGCECPFGYTDCNGTCKNLSLDAQNCGGCGTVCLGGRTCQNGVCACPSGYTDCSGTCKDLNSDALNCGSCGNVCPTGCGGTRSCRLGVCVQPTTYPLIVESLPSKCFIQQLYTVSAMSASEAISCGQQAFPPDKYVVGVTGGNYTYAVNCPGYVTGFTCQQISNVIALSESDGLSCVIWNVTATRGDCTVSPGPCPPS